MLKAGENKSVDLVLQMLFIFGLILVCTVFYLTRIGGIKAEDKNVNSYGLENLQTAFQFEQEELKIQARIKVLKSDYANDLMLYRSQLDKISKSTDYSDLEKREKLIVLNNLYSQEYFDRKQSLIDEQNLLLENLQRLKCAKFCSSEDLLSVQK